MVQLRTRPALIPVLALTTAGLLSACGDIKDALDFKDGRDAFRSSRDALEARSNTAYRAVPDTGNATYRGEASLGAGTGEQGVVLIGDAAITVDFDSGQVSGELSNFGGFDSDKEYSDYAGSLVLQGGILGSQNPNDVDAQIVGSLTSEDYVIGVDALWEGHLKGTPIVGVLGDTTGSQSTFTLNGEPVAGGIIVAVTD